MSSQRAFTWGTEEMALRKSAGILCGKLVICPYSIKFEANTFTVTMMICIK